MLPANSPVADLRRISLHSQLARLGQQTATNKAVIQSPREALLVQERNHAAAWNNLNSRLFTNMSVGKRPYAGQQCALTHTGAPGQNR